MTTEKKPLERISAFHDGPFVGYFVGTREIGPFVAQFVREDIYDAVTRERDDLRAENERLRGLVPRPDMTGDEMIWRDYMRGVPLETLAREHGITRERMRYRVKRIAKNMLALNHPPDAEASS